MYKHPRQDLISMYQRRSRVDPWALNYAEELLTAEAAAAKAAELSMHVSRLETQANRWETVSLALILLWFSAIFGLLRQPVFDFVIKHGMSDTGVGATTILGVLGFLFAFLCSVSIGKNKAGMAISMRQRLALLAPVTSTEDLAQVSRYSMGSPDAKAWYAYALEARESLSQFDLVMMRGLQAPAA